MKMQNNIEEQFEQLKDAYRVPERYFEQISVPKPPKAKIITLRSVKKYFAAAALLVLITLGYKVWHWQEGSRQLQHHNSTAQITNNTQLFDDITDEEIIDYLIDEDFSDDQILDL